MFKWQQEIKRVSNIEPESKNTQKEFFRIGYDFNSHRTTITLLDDNGLTMTLSMTEEACEHFIGMIRSSYPKKIDTEEKNLGHFSGYPDIAYK